MPRSQFPSYCLHRSSDQAVTVIQTGTKRKYHYLGVFGSEDSLTRYADLLRSVRLAENLIVQAVATARETVRERPTPPPTTPSNVLTLQALYNAFQTWAPSYH